MIGGDDVISEELRTISTIRSGQYVTVEAIERAWHTNNTPGQHQLLFNSLCDIVAKINRKKLAVTEPVFTTITQCLTDTELYIKPSLLKAVERNQSRASLQCWQALLDHPFTPTLAKTNLQFYVTCTAAVLNYMSSLEYDHEHQLLKTTLEHTYLRLVYNSNKKQSYNLTVEHLLCPLLNLYPDPDKCSILTDTVLSADNLTQLEAHLIAKMANFTKLLVDKLRGCDSVQCLAVYKIICARVKSRNKSRLLLNLYLNINNKDVERNEKLLDVIAQNRLYQVKEDKEQGNVITDFLLSFMAGLGGAEYSRICVKVLPLNHYIVDVEHIVKKSWLSDELLATLFTVYSRLGELPNLFTKLYQNPWCLSQLAILSKERLQQISCKLTTAQVLALLDLNINTITALSCSKEQECSEKRPRLDEAPVSFMAECTHVLLTYTRSVDINSLEFRDKMISLSAVVPSLPAAAQSTLYLSLTELVKCGKLDTSLCPVLSLEVLDSSTSVLLFIQQLSYSTDPQHDLDLLLSHCSTYWTELLTSIHLVYNMLGSEHLVKLTDVILLRLGQGCEVTLQFITSHLFMRLNDLHSCLVDTVFRRVNGEEVAGRLLENVLEDLSMSKAKELVKHELEQGITEEIDQYNVFIKVLKQLPPSCMNSTHFKKMCVIWQISRRKEGAVKLLTILCRPPPTFISLPQLHGLHAGRVIVQVLKQGKTSDEMLYFLEEYLSAGLLLTSVDLTQLWNFFITDHSHDVDNLNLRTCCKVLSTKPSSVERYNKALLALNASLQTRISSERNVASFNILSSHAILSKLLNLPFAQSQCCTTILNTADVPAQLKIDLICTLIQSENADITALISTLVSVITPETIQYLPESFLTNEIVPHLIPLLTSYPDKVELLLNQNRTQITYEKLEELTSVPLSLLPAMMSALSKEQVLTSLFTAEGCDPLILTKCMLAMLQNSYQIHTLTPILAKTMKALLESPSSETLSQLTRVCEQIAKQKDAARHHSPYILMILFDTMSRGTSEIISGLTPACYPLLGVIASQGLLFLGARLSGGSKELFTSIHTHYSTNVKYQGKT